MNLESIDLPSLVRSLRKTLGEYLVLSYVPGKTALRDATMDLLQCSAQQAEELVDTLEGRGMISYDPGRNELPRTLGRWRLQPHNNSVGPGDA